MGEEKETFWLVKLLNSKYINKLIGAKSGCKRDFEVELNIFENDKRFRKFLNELIKLNVLEISKLNKNSKYYLINKKRLIKVLRNDSVYITFKKAVEIENGQLLIFD